jgi:hypothetical protein
MSHSALNTTNTPIKAIQSIVSIQIPGEKEIQC